MLRKELVDRDAFARTGYIVVPGFLNEKLLHKLNGLLEKRFESKSSSSKSSSSFLFIKCLQILNRDLQDLLGETELPRLMKSFFDVPVEIIRDEAVVKLAHERASFPWHQDGAYFRQKGLVTAFIALSDVGPDRGGIEVVPGSNEMGIVPHEDGKSGPSINDEKLLQGAESLHLKAGTLVLIHPQLVHRSAPNLSDRAVSSYTLLMAPKAA